ncbi:monosaccharide-sensing protein 2 [Chrysochromulina tobinii]|uniref:Monosaccharide-sensing protein 2 n=1 Tax=Chrysochromulina tobinii TaxID=1460289 RepID=A0A0M0JIU0_9EUKA|nr:monosaccharide-sensing protein 2 [Chrysochromulina tobinii]KOO26505.1 monosaccharide-sensing protein 2 [Chrysochromulina tobinii]|eukprot:KOO26479.1 monosaccharide-sensing protein 2 [Chrysochromulina sp. CCMP291]
MVVPSSRKRAGLQVAAGAALGSLLQGFNTGVIAGALLGISSEFGLAARPAVTGLIASSTTMGAVVGTACSGKLCDWVGRKRTLVLSSACFVLGGLLMAWSPGSEVLVAGRMTVGLAAGIVSSAVPTYIAECAEPAQRGALSTLPQLCVSSGILLSYLVGLGGLVLGHSWRVMLGLSLVPALFQALLCQQFCGVNAIVYFTPSILKKAGAPAMFTALGVTQPDVAAMLATVMNAITAAL